MSLALPGRSWPSADGRLVHHSAQVGRTPIRATAATRTVTLPPAAPSGRWCALAPGVVLIAFTASVLALLLLLAGLPGASRAGAETIPATRPDNAVTSVGSAPAGSGASLGAAGASGCDIVHLGPYIAPGSAASSYFELTLSRGALAREAVVVANPEPYPCRVTLVAAYGATAVNGGDSYVPVAGQGCRGASCWLGHLPETVTVPARSRENVAFPVSVPLNATSGQYLAGVIGEPASPPKPAAVSATNHQQGVVSAAVVARVAIGVAITIPGSLVPRLAVPSVVLSNSTVPPSLEVLVDNSGNTWIHPAGHVELALASGTSIVRLRSATVLPGDNAQLDVPVGRVPPGPHRVIVELPYGGGHIARWIGTISFPAASAVAPPRPGTVTTVITETTIPTWVIVVIVALGSAFLLAVLVAIVLLLRRRRRRSSATPAEPPGAPPALEHWPASVASGGQQSDDPLPNWRS